MIPVTATSPHGPRRNGATRCPAYKIAPPVPALSAYLSNPGVSCVLAKADIRVAHLVVANLSGANLRGASLQETDLGGAIQRMTQRGH